jgi:hypothetical protein
VKVFLLYYVPVFGVLLMLITWWTAPIYHEATNLGFTRSLVLLAIFYELVTGLSDLYGKVELIPIQESDLTNSSSHLWKVLRLTVTHLTMRFQR